MCPINLYKVMGPHAVYEADVTKRNFPPSVLTAPNF